MSNPIETADSLSHSPKHVENIARFIGRGSRWKVFDAIYHQKMQVKSITDIIDKTKLDRKSVVNAARELYNKRYVKLAPKKNGELAYQKIDSITGVKQDILKLARNSKKLDAFAAKRRGVIVN